MEVPFSSCCLGASSIPNCAHVLGLVSIKETLLCIMDCNGGTTSRMRYGLLESLQRAMALMQLETKLQREQAAVASRGVYLPLVQPQHCNRTTHPSLRPNTCVQKADKLIYSSFFL